MSQHREGEWGDCDDGFRPASRPSGAEEGERCFGCRVGWPLENGMHQRPTGRPPFACSTDASPSPTAGEAPLIRSTDEALVRSVSNELSHQSLHRTAQDLDDLADRLRLAAIPAPAPVPPAEAPTACKCGRCYSGVVREYDGLGGSQWAPCPNTPASPTSAASPMADSLAEPLTENQSGSKPAAAATEPDALDWLTQYVAGWNKDIRPADDYHIFGALNLSHLRAAADAITALRHRITELEGEREKLNRRVELANHARDRYLPCPDHRDKVTPGECQVCCMESALTESRRQQEALRQDKELLDWWESATECGFYRPGSADPNWTIVVPDTRSAEERESGTLNGETWAPGYQTIQRTTFREALAAALARTSGGRDDG